MVPLHPFARLCLIVKEDNSNKTRVNILLFVFASIFFASLVAYVDLEMAMSGCWSVYHFGPYRNTLTIIGWIAMKCCINRPHSFIVPNGVCATMCSFSLDMIQCVKMSGNFYLSICLLNLDATSKCLICVCCSLKSTIVCIIERYKFNI